MALLSVCALSCSGQDAYRTIRGYAQGGTYTVRYNSRGVSESPAAVREAVEAILQEIDTTLSGYNKGSMLSRFNRGETVVPNALFLDIFDFSLRYYLASEGALDVASGPVFDIWGFGFTTDSLPPQERIDSALAVSGMMRLVPSLRNAVLADGTLRPTDAVLRGDALPRLNYNAVAQGYSCDRVAEYLYGLGVKDLLVDIGEIFCDGVNPSGKPWSIGVDTPSDGNNVPGASLSGVWTASGGPSGVVTSGNYRKFYIKDGRKYAHTIDPRTGYPCRDSLLSATIVAPTAADADAVATWAMVLGFEKARSLILARDEWEGLLIYGSADGSMKEWASPGMQIRKANGQ